MTDAEVRFLLLETSAVARAREAVLRIFLSRGTGGFSVSPGECSQPHIYIIVTAPEPVPASFYLHGMKVITSRVPLRDPAFAEMKGCNYQPNALLELEAIQAEADSALWVDEEGYLAEGSNKNVAIVTPEPSVQGTSFSASPQGDNAPSSPGPCPEAPTGGCSDGGGAVGGVAGGGLSSG